MKFAHPERPSFPISLIMVICINAALLNSASGGKFDSKMNTNTVSAHLGTFEDAGAAIAKKDYATALRIYHFIANNGSAFALGRIGIMHANGLGVPKNLIEAAKWYRRAAEQGSDYGQTLLGMAYYKGEGVPQDYVKAHTWLSLAASTAPAIIGLRDSLARLMTRAQIAEAQKLAAEWRPKTADASPERQQETPSEMIPETYTGTAFFVSREGAVLTNAHVVESCKKIRVARSAARLIAKDAANDIALLATDLHPTHWANWRPSVQQGEDIVVYGFPLAGVLSSSGNVVTGNVTALAGVGDDGRYLQISAPVQPGNSGGPLFDRYGNVVGIVVAKLDALRVATATGDIPQNVNFAIKASVAAAFLEAQHVKEVSDDWINVGALSTPDIAARAQALAAQVVCVR